MVCCIVAGQAPGLVFPKRQDRLTLQTDRSAASIPSRHVQNAVSSSMSHPSRLSFCKHLLASTRVLSFLVLQDDPYDSRLCLTAGVHEVLDRDRFFNCNRNRPVPSVLKNSITFLPTISADTKNKRFNTVMMLDIITAFDAMIAFNNTTISAS